jgi:hypothetical protein
MAPTMTKRETNYRIPAKTDEPCRDCTMFRTPGSCSLVKGAISPHGHCEEFERKGATHAVDST